MAEQLPTTVYKTPYKFNGKELDAETGLYYYGARYYDPKISLWLGVDPMMEKGPESSPYCYAMNNPLNMVDPDGRWPFPIGPISLFIFKTVGNFYKGADSGTKQRYQTEPARGDTKTGLRDTNAGRVSKTTGKTAGDWVVRADQARVFMFSYF